MKGKQKLIQSIIACLIFRKSIKNDSEVKDNYEDHWENLSKYTKKINHIESYFNC